MIIILIIAALILGFSSSDPFIVIAIFSCLLFMIISIYFFSNSYSKYYSDSIRESNIYKKICKEVIQSIDEKEVDFFKLRMIIKSHLKNDHMNNYFLYYPFSKILSRSILIHIINVINKNTDITLDNKIYYLSLFCNPLKNETKLLKIKIIYVKNKTGFILANKLSRGFST